MELLDILCIFLASGKTFTFRDVTILSNNEYALTFIYVATSDKLVKIATFYRSHLAGISKTERQMEEGETK